MIQFSTEANQENEDRHKRSGVTTVPGNEIKWFGQDSPANAIPDQPASSFPLFPSVQLNRPG